MKIKQMINKIGLFIKKDPVLFASFLLAVISCIFVKPSKAYLGYIDYKVICILYSLMVVVAGLKRAGVFEFCISEILKKAKDTRKVSVILVLACFFFSMLITNDVALITFVPLTIMIFSGDRGARFLIPVVVLETVAANLGSQLTPIGNPQNLYIYSLFNIKATEFVLLMLPLAASSFLLVFLGIFFIKKENIQVEKNTSSVDKKMTVIWLSLFLVCLLCVVHILPYQLALMIVLVVGFIFNKSLLYKADFALLLTFIFFFVFIGNMKNVPEISAVLENIIEGNEINCGVFLSQVVSNVPAAMLLSGFTENFKELLFGVNLGGLGTLIASMASLISYKMYAGTENAQIGKYVFKFTLVNLIFLIILWPIALILV